MGIKKLIKFIPPDISFNKSELKFEQNLYIKDQNICTHLVNPKQNNQLKLKGQVLFCLRRKTSLESGKFINWLSRLSATGAQGGRQSPPLAGKILPWCEK